MNNDHKALTESQLAIWIGQRLNPEAPLYNMAHSFDIKGALDADAFEKAFKELIRSVDSLRTVFNEVDGVPYQYVLENIDENIEILDFTEKEPDTIHAWMKERCQRMFDLTKPLFDSVLLKVRPNRYIWFLNIHHLVTDATSSTILYQLQNDLYGAILANAIETVTKTPNFSSYIEYESEQKNAPMAKAIKDFWKSKISTLNKSPELYGEKNVASTSRATRIFLKLGNERSKSLRELAQKPDIRSWTQDMTLFNLFITTLFIFLHRVSGQKKLAVGAPSNNRPTKYFKKTPGLFMEVFPLVTEFEDDDTFLSVLNRIKLETNDYLRHAQSGMSSSAIGRSFDIVLNYINAAFKDFNGLPMHSTWIHPDHCDSGHQLRCHVYDMDASGEIELFFDLNNDVFSKTLQQEVPKHFLRLLDALLSNPYQTIYQPSLVEIELKKVKPISKKYQSIVQQFEEQVTKNPLQVALRCKNEKYTYAQLNEKSNQLANYLSIEGVRHNQRIAVYLKRSPEYIIAVLAILKLGAVFIPVPSELPLKRLAYILEDADVSTILTQEELAGQITGHTAKLLKFEKIIQDIAQQDVLFASKVNDKKDTSYIIYTSGSTGNPKGVLISHSALFNYLDWAKGYYKSEEKFIFPLFTSIGFDLTITSTFLPLITGGEIVIYKETAQGPDLSLTQVLEENRVNYIKLTPSHLALIQRYANDASKIRTMIVGGEDLKTITALAVQDSFGDSLRIFNEYGPTESTVGCIVSRFNRKEHTKNTVPIGLPIDGVSAYILDDHMNAVPQGVVGSLYLSGESLADGYVNLPELTSEKFIANPFFLGERLYQTGDLARLNTKGIYEFLGRADEQIKLRGFRIELSDIESNLSAHENVNSAAVVLLKNKNLSTVNEVTNCAECGLPSNYPSSDFDEKGVCHLCNAFKGYKDKAARYFKTENELRSILTREKGQNLDYDCLALLSGGKDSTYILAQLVNMGLKVLAFTLDNGYISEQAKENINRIVDKLGVDHIYGQTPHMNKIFVDSLQRHQNVCNGCFKTIYTLSTKIALEKKIPYVVTGLSRGQFFETRLTEELFWDEHIDVKTIDDTILEARKLYHKEGDAVKTHLDVSIFDYEDTYSKVQFIDFYRYSDVSLEEMLRFLKEKVDWVRPTDTGRSTNCLINQVGIYVHKKKKGYSNYAFPYSWDVRMGHKTRVESLEEINETIDEKEVQRIMDEIGYFESLDDDLNQDRLVGYYTGSKKTSARELRAHLKKQLPDYMVPSYFKHIAELPLTSNGKVDKGALKSLTGSQLKMDTPFVAPKGEIEELLAEIWKEVLRLKQVGVHDDFIVLGGHSLAAIRVTARINEEVEVKFPLNKIFELPTISEYAKHIEETLIALLEE